MKRKTKKFLVEVEFSNLEPYSYVIPTRNLKIMIKKGINEIGDLCYDCNYKVKVTAQK